MSRSPLPTTSTATQLEIGERVQRLCDQAGPVGQKYAELVMEAHDVLKHIAEDVRPRTFERITRYDALVLAEARLDEAVRSAFYACRKYDWNDENAPICEKVFPGGVFSPIVTAPRDQKRELVTRMITRLQTTAPDDGQLASVITALETTLELAAEAETIYEASLVEVSKYKALESR